MYQTSVSVQNILCIRLGKGYKIRAEITSCRQFCSSTLHKESPQQCSSKLSFYWWAPGYPLAKHRVGIFFNSSPLEKLHCCSIERGHFPATVFVNNYFMVYIELIPRGFLEAPSFTPILEPDQLGVSRNHEVWQGKRGLGNRVACLFNISFLFSKNGQNCKLISTRGKHFLLVSPKFLLSNKLRKFFCFPCVSRATFKNVKLNKNFFIFEYSTLTVNIF